MKLLVLGIIIGAFITWVYTNKGSPQIWSPTQITQNKENVLADYKSEKETSEGDVDEVEAKIDEIKDQLSSNFDVSEDCSSDNEKKALLKRLACNQKSIKAKKYWNSMEEAEKAVLNFFVTEKAIELIAYTDCNAIDITWYEMHCEVDRQYVELENFKILFNKLKTDDLSVADGHWERKKPNLREIINPRWVKRSRLIVRGFKLHSPWKVGPHPTENEVVILLEEKLGGKVYIVGLPITGIRDED